MAVEDLLLERIARGGLVSQDEYDQLAGDLPPELLANALARRFSVTGESRMLVEAARLYFRAGNYYDALEACSRAPRLHELQKIISQTLPHLRQEYPETHIRLVGKLLEEAFLVIDLTTGAIVRFPPLLPARL
ncbi:MAG TPA: hypothetical protein VF806_06660 [Anaerolineaceae bacterium]